MSVIEVKSVFLCVLCDGDHSRGRFGRGTESSSTFYWPDCRRTAQLWIIAWPRVYSSKLWPKILLQKALNCTRSHRNCFIVTRGAWIADHPETQLRNKNVYAKGRASPPPPPLNHKAASLICYQHWRSLGPKQKLHWLSFAIKLHQSLLVIKGQYEQPTFFLPGSCENRTSSRKIIL
jgi:hypothetical protein